MWTHCNLAEWSKYHGFQLCDLCIRMNEKFQNPKLSPANEEPSERWKSATFAGRDDRYGYEFWILQAENSEKKHHERNCRWLWYVEYGFPYSRFTWWNLKYMQCLCIILVCTWMCFMHIFQWEMNLAIKEVAVHFSKLVTITVTSTNCFQQLLHTWE